MTADFDDVESFESYLRKVNKFAPPLLDIRDAIRVWGKPLPFMSSFGWINRCDGCSWLTHTDIIKKYGLMKPLVGGISGDVTWHDEQQRDGFEMLIVRDVCTWHMVRSESSNQYE